MSSLTAPLKRRAKAALGTRSLAAVAGRVAVRRHHALVLLFHRVGTGPAPHEVVETVAADTFRAQLDVLGRLGDVVPLHELTGGRSDVPRPRFALAFDDDYDTHLDVVAELLAERDLPATFFVGGRALHGLGAYWWEVLEDRVAADGVESTARDLGVSADSPAALAARIEGTRTADALAATGHAHAHRHLDEAQLRRLATTPGVTIGFHTLHHPVMAGLPADGLRAAVQAGRSELEQAVRRPLQLFAYPHGKADAQAAAAVREGEFHAAWTGRFAPVRAGADPFLLGRYEPHHLDPDAFASAVALRLNREAPAP
jgi:peptidoglycan/xylan/chitin deacetylase (PgdA/CDA1 family)